MYVLVGFTTLVVSLLISGLAAYLPARWFARWLGLEDFRIFDVSRSERFVRSAAVRLVSIVAPLLLVLLTAAGALLVRGEPVATNLVEVLPGPAMAAGVQSGDRIVTINGVATPEFEAIRREVRNAKPSVEMVIERAGARRTVSVTPDEKGAIRIVAAMERRRISLVEAVGESSHLIGWFAAVTLGSGHDELAGPIAVVNGVVAGTRSSWWDSSLQIGCYLGCNMALLVFALHLFDGLTYGWYLVSLKSRGSARLASTLARRRQALGLALSLGILGLAAITAAEAADVNLETRLEFVAKAMLTLAIPLAWLVMLELYGKRRALAVAFLFFVPLLNVMLPLVIWFVAGRRLRSE